MQSTNEFGQPRSFSVLVVGDTKAGKTSLITSVQHKKNSFPNSISFLEKNECNLREPEDCWIFEFQETNSLCLVLFVVRASQGLSHKVIEYSKFATQIELPFAVVISDIFSVDTTKWKNMQQELSKSNILAFPVNSTERQMFKHTLPVQGINEVFNYICINANNKVIDTIQKNCSKILTKKDSLHHITTILITSLHKFQYLFAYFIQGFKFGWFCINAGVIFLLRVFNFKQKQS
mmetsp:Transcript_25382/g.35587  ORF Transcript_25382/g.35587 Transcript_25382/m.35587 type:complete len:234 (-) Transcript_25382:51-752(-)